MICPILQSGLMLKAVTLRRYGGGVYSEYHAPLQAEKSAECMGDECEWYQQGCPAHPAKKSKK